MAKKKQRGHQRGGTLATVALTRAGVDFVLHHYEHDPRAESYGLEAADALGLDPARVFKTLVATLDGELVVAVVPVTGELDLKALARVLGGSRAAMAEVAVAERATGYVAGGISPFGQRRRHRTALDVSALTFVSVFVSAGRRGLDLEIAPADLVATTEAVTGQIGRSRS